MERHHTRQGGGWKRRMRREETVNPLQLKPRGFTRPPLAEREIRFHRFREALGEARFASFMAHIRSETRVDACGMLDEALKQGGNLLDLVLTGDEDGYWFNFRRYPGDRWGLEFGVNAGPLAGDCGVWAVCFDENGGIAKIRLWRHRIS